MAAFWFFYFAALGVFVPYYSLYLREGAGLCGLEIGLVQAAIPLVGLVSQPVWGQVADRTGARTRVLAVLTAGAAAAFLGLGAARGFTGLLLLTGLFAVVSTAIIPLAVSVSMAELGETASRSFGFIRVWGTISFLVSVVVFPWWVEATGSVNSSGPRSGLAAMFPVMAVCAAVAAVVAWRLPRTGDVGARAARGDWRLLVGDRSLHRLLGFVFGAYLFTQGPMMLFPIYIRSLGGDAHMVSRMWIVMLVLEIPLVAVSGPGFRRFGGRRLLGIGTAACGLRWLICGLTNDARWVYPVQLLHGVVVAGLMVGASLLVDGIVPARLRSTAQSLVSLVGGGGATIASHIVAGWLVDRVGVAAPYLIGGVGALVLGALGPWVLPSSRAGNGAGG